MKENSNWIFLSYLLDENLSGYGNGEQIKIDFYRNQKRGDTSTNSKITLPTHFGTHIDFPKHFSIEGNDVSVYKAQEFIYSEIQFIDISNENINNYLINSDNLKFTYINNNAELIIVKTSFCEYRNKDKYWKQGWGFDLGVASYLKTKFPKLRAIAFDLISLNSYQQREIGREAHKEFLIDNNILIIEDVDLTLIDENINFKQIIVSPLRYNKAEGAPVTIFAEIIN